MADDDRWVVRQDGKRYRFEAGATTGMIRNWMLRETGKFDAFEILQRPAEADTTEFAEPQRAELAPGALDKPGSPNRRVDVTSPEGRMIAPPGAEPQVGAERMFDTSVPEGMTEPPGMRDDWYQYLPAGLATVAGLVGTEGLAAIPLLARVAGAALLGSAADTALRPDKQETPREAAEKAAWEAGKAVTLQGGLNLGTRAAAPLMKRYAGRVGTSIYGRGNPRTTETILEERLLPGWRSGAKHTENRLQDLVGTARQQLSNPAVGGIQVNATGRAVAPTGSMQQLGMDLSNRVYAPGVTPTINQVTSGINRGFAGKSQSLNAYAERGIMDAFGNLDDVTGAVGQAGEKAALLRRASADSLDAASYAARQHGATDASTTLGRLSRMVPAAHRVAMPRAGAGIDLATRTGPQVGPARLFLPDMLERAMGQTGRYAWAGAKNPAGMAAGVYGAGHAADALLGPGMFSEAIGPDAIRYAIIEGLRNQGVDTDADLEEGGAGGIRSLLMRNEQPTGVSTRRIR